MSDEQLRRFNRELDRLAKTEHIYASTAEGQKDEEMTATTETITASDIIDDQDLMKEVPASEREQMGVAILSAAALDEDCLAMWLTVDDQQWPVTNGVDEWEHAAAVAAWQEFLATGTSRTDWFRSTYNSVD